MTGTVASLACAALLIASVAEAVEGRVIDQRTGRPVAGAQISIAGLAGTVRTDRDGRFTWAPDPALPFVILIILPGGRLARPVPVLARQDNGPLLIQVDPAVDERIAVYGSAPTVDAPPGAAATLLPSAVIEQRAPANLTEALENVTGIGHVGEGHTSVPTIRGLARGRTLALLDGARLFSERRTGASVSFIAPETLDRIEVVRGPATVAYGSDAFGGVISMVTRQPADARLSTRLTATVGTGVPTARATAQVAARIGPRASFLVAMHRRDAGDYTSPDDVVSNSSWQDRGALVRGLARAGGWWTATWQLDSIGASGFPRSDADMLRVSSPFERSQRIGLAFDRAGLPGIDQLSISGGHSRYAQRVDQERLPGPGRTRRIDRADIAGTDLELRAVVRTPLGRSRFTTGLDVNARRDLDAHDIAIAFNAADVITSVTDNSSIASAHRRDLGGFAQVDVPLASFMTLTAGARIDDVRSVNAGGFFGDRAVSHDAASGSLAVAARPHARLLLTAQIARGFHDPTLSDRFYRGPVGRGFVTGNPDLHPERSVQFDASARVTGRRWNATGSYYHYDISDLIERYQSTPDAILFRNRDRARIRGAELDVHVDGPWGVGLDGSARVSRGRARDDGTPLDDIAPGALIVQARKAFGARLLVTGRVAGIARHAASGPSEVATPGYTDAGATATFRVHRLLELRVAASNLLNARAYSSTSARWVYAPGRNATFTVVIAF